MLISFPNLAAAAHTLILAVHASAYDPLDHPHLGVVSPSNLTPGPITGHFVLFGVYRALP